MSARLHPTPPWAEQRITELFAWIATRESGAEGIISADMHLPGVGLRHTALITSRRDLADKLEAIAREAEALSALEGQPVTIRLDRFVLASDAEPIP